MLRKQYRKSKTKAPDAELLNEADDGYPIDYGTPLTGEKAEKIKRIREQMIERMKIKKD